MKRGKNENTAKESPQNDSTPEAEIIAFSANLISCLEEKKKLFNKENKSDLKIKELKEVYERGTSSEEDNLNLHGLARVNMFLRQKEFKEKSAPEKYSSSVDFLVFEETEGSLDLEFDISEDWKPSDEDYELAKADEEKFNLNLKFSSFDELYIEEYKPIDFYWE
tara:strand:+ start:213 stop:707 length:495 start_codon:yes stop_codon:yes gene_type:complete